MNIGAVIVAAGLSSRMGDFKPLLPLGKTTVIEHVVKTFQSAGIEKIAVVLGHNGKEIEKVLAHNNIIFIYNKDYKSSDMFVSAKLGIETLKDSCDGILFIPADIPLFTKETIKKLIQAEGNIRKPVYEKRGGHPLYFGKKMYSVVLDYAGDSGMKGAIGSTEEKITYVEVDDSGILYDMDTKEDYIRILGHLVE